MGLALAANAGRIHKAELAAFEFDDLVHGVAGGAGDGRDDGSGCARERVQQRGLAHVGPADDGHRGFVLLELAVGAVQRTQLLVRCLCRDIFRFRGVEIRGGLGFLGGRQARGGDAFFGREIEGFNFELLFAGECFRLRLVIFADADAAEGRAGDAVGGGFIRVFKWIYDKSAASFHTSIMANIKANVQIKVKNSDK